MGVMPEQCSIAHGATYSAKNVMRARTEHLDVQRERASLLNANLLSHLPRAPEIERVRPAIGDFGRGGMPAAEGGS